MLKLQIMMLLSQRSNLVFGTIPKLLPEYTNQESYRNVSLLNFLPTYKTSAKLEQGVLTEQLMEKRNNHEQYIKGSYIPPGIPPGAGSSNPETADKTAAGTRWHQLKPHRQHPKVCVE